MRSAGQGDAVEGHSHEVRVHPSCFTGICMVFPILETGAAPVRRPCIGWWNWGGFPRGHASIMGESGLGD